MIEHISAQRVSVGTVAIRLPLPPDDPVVSQQHHPMCEQQRLVDIVGYQHHGDVQFSRRSASQCRKSTRVAESRALKGSSSNSSSGRVATGPQDGDPCDCPPGELVGVTAGEALKPEAHPISSRA